MNTKAKKASTKQYWPLISLILVSMLAAFAINWRVNGGATIWMHYFMGMFLLVFSVLKLFHPAKFAMALQCIIFWLNDHVFMLMRVIELTLELLYISFILLMLTYVLTIVILAFGSIGMIRALKAGLDINCPCMGSILDVPLWRYAHNRYTLQTSKPLRIRNCLIHHF